MSQVSTASSLTPALMQQSVNTRAQQEQVRSNQAREALQGAAINQRAQEAQAAQQLGQQRLDVVQQEGAANREAQAQNYQNLNEARALEADKQREFERAKLQQVQEFTLKQAETARQNAITDMKNQMRFDLAGRMGELSYMTTLQNQAFEMDRLNRNREGRIRAESNRIKTLGEEMVKGMGLDQSIDMVLTDSMTQSLAPNQMTYGVDENWFFGITEQAVGEAPDVTLFNFYKAGGLGDVEAAKKVQESLGGMLFQGGTGQRQDAFASAISSYGDAGMVNDVLNRMSAHDRTLINRYADRNLVEKLGSTGVDLDMPFRSKFGAGDIDRMSGRSSAEVMDHMLARAAVSIERTTGPDGPGAELTHRFLKGMIDGTIDEATVSEIQASGHGQMLGHLLTRMQSAVQSQTDALYALDPAEAGSMGAFNIPGEDEQTVEDRTAALGLLRSQMTDMRDRLNIAVGSFDANGGQGSLSSQVGYVHPDVVQGMFSNLRQLYMDSGSIDEMESAIAAIPDENIRRQLATSIAVLGEQRDPIDPRPFGQAGIDAQRVMYQEQLDLLDEIFGEDDG
jgi:hypothetical protein